MRANVGHGICSLLGVTASGLFLAGGVSATSLSVHVYRTARRAGQDDHRQAEAQGGFRLPVVLGAAPLRR